MLLKNMFYAIICRNQFEDYIDMKETFRIAKTLLEVSEWSITNLQLHKMLYIANRVYLARTGEQLVDSEFEAWDYGPVLPQVYNECKMWGGKPIKGGMYLVSPYTDGKKFDYITEVFSSLKKYRSGQLVANTHIDGGGWSRVYKKGQKGIKITKDDILAENKVISKIVRK